MSDSWIIRPKISYEEFTAAIEEFNWSTGFECGSQWIHDGTSHLHVDIYDNEVVGFTRFGIQTSLDNMICKIEMKFRVKAIIEHDPRYWDIVNTEGG